MTRIGTLCMTPVHIHLLILETQLFVDFQASINCS